MNDTIDQSISKRPIQTPDNDEALENLQVQRMELATTIKEIDALIETKEDPTWAALVKESYVRLQEIERKRMTHDPRDIPWHCEVVGQWNERFLLTRELISAKRLREVKVSQMESLTKRILKIVTRKSKGT